jgi:FMN phosphatase YigB (HAD superfamily)
MKPKAIICDLDGTLADIRVRLKHLEGKKKDWKSFNKSIETDDLHEWCRQILIRFRSDHKIIIVSGRTDELKKETKAWLEKFDVPFDYIFMRKAKDFRPDNLIKLEIYENQIRDKFSVLFVLDDRQKVVDMWRAEGLVVLQCAPGDF